MTKQHWGDDEIGRGAMTDTRKELQLRRQSEWSNREWKNSRTQRKTQKESEVIRETETHWERILQRQICREMGEEKRAREVARLRT